MNINQEFGSITRAVIDGLPVIDICSLGAVPYLTALETQQNLVLARQAGRIHDRLLLLEHPAVITIGVSGLAHQDHVVATPDELQDSGIEILNVRRGGDVTYHGPGQLVGYPVIDLKPDRCDVRRYIRDLEEVLIRTVASFGVEAGRLSGLTGVWVGREKLAAIGVRLSRWVTSHGFALNVTTNLADFDLIVPCGLQGYGVTSLEQLLGVAPVRHELDAVLAGEFGRVFGRRVGAWR